MTETITSYGLRHKKEGYLMHVDERGNGDSEFCSSTTVSFGGKHGDRLYETENILNAISSLIAETPWYNSDSDKPENRGYNMKEFEIVKLVKTVSTSPVEVKLPKSLDDVCEWMFDVYSTDADYIEGVKYGCALKEGVKVKVGQLFLRSIGNDLFEVVKLGENDNKKPLAFLKKVDGTKLGVDKAE